MTRIQHMQAAGLAIMVLLGGELFFNLIPGEYSLRGTSDFYAQRLEKRANDTLEIFMKTVKEQSLKKEQLESIVDRLKDIEGKLQQEEKTPKLHDITGLQDKLASLDGKLKTHEGTSVNSDKDLKALEERLSSFESKMKDKNVNDNDLVTLKQRMSAFENKLKTHQDGTVKKQDLDLLNEFISTMENKIHTLDKTVNTTPSDQDDGAHKDNVKADPVKKPSAAGQENTNENSAAGTKTSKQRTFGTVSVSPGKNKAGTVVSNVGQKDDASQPAPNDAAPASEQNANESGATSKKRTFGTVSVSPGQNKVDAFVAERTVVKPPILSKQELALLDKFNPEHAPIMGNRRPNINKPVRVRALLLSPKKRLDRKREGHMKYISDEMFNIALDGLERSPYFQFLEPTVVPDHRMKDEFVIQEQQDVVWVVDSRNLAPSIYSAYSIDEEVLMAANATINYQKTLNVAKKPSLSVVFIDYRDKIAGRASNCGPERQALIKLLKGRNVRHVVGRIAADRHWSDEKNWVEPGTVWDSTDETCSKNPMIYSPYTVRSDYVEAVERLYPKFLASEVTKKGGNAKQLTPVDTVRPLDVTYYWDQQRATGRKSEYRYHSQLRNTVSGVVLSLNGTMAGSRTISAKAETVSEGGSTGRTDVFESYVESLLTTKIVVVAQRDIWEDHYRLFEAFVGGAMVMTDSMLSLPAGLVDGENINVYRSRDDLREMLMHYLSPEQDEARLAIAQKGYEAVMGRHRSYHRMEEVFYGKPLSSALLSPGPSKDNTNGNISAATVPQAKSSMESKPNTPKKRTFGTVSVSPGKTNKAGTIVAEHHTAKPPILNKQELKLLETFNPEHAPIMGDRPADINKPPRVRVLLMSPKKRRVRSRERGMIDRRMGLLGDETINVVFDGLDRSPFFELLEPTIVPDHKSERDFVLEEPEDVIWVVDSRNLTIPSYHYSVDEEVLIAAKATVKYQQSLKTTKKPSLSVVFVDYRDRLAGRGAMCGPEREELIKLLGVGKVRHVVGKIVTGRHWDTGKNWTQPGTIWDNKDNECFGKPTIRAPYSVRSDYAEAVERLFPKYLWTTAKGNKDKSVKQLTPVDTVRPLDVAHYWDQQRAEGRENEYRHYSYLRDAVSKVVSSLNGTMAGKRKIRALAGTVSEGGSIGRTDVADSYVESLLTTKIVVVAQRDIWEDHYRLFEAFVGGAMVMTDLMISLPPGLVDGENIIMYRSLDDLRELLLYYLHPDQDEARKTIARKGYEEAMGRHQSYHRMEEVFYGKPLSSASLPRNASKEHS